MQLILNEQLKGLKRSRVLDSFEFLKSQGSIFGQITEGDLVASFVIKRHLKFFSVLNFLSAPEGIGAESFTQRIPRFIQDQLPFIDVISQSAATALFPVIPPETEGIPFGSYVISLTGSQEDLFRGLHSKHRNVIKSATTKGVKVSFGVQHLADAYRVIAAGYEKQGLTSYSLNYLQKMKECLGDYIEVATVFNSDGSCVAAAVFYFDNSRAYYFLGGVSDEAINGTMNALLWHAIIFFKGRGLEQFDFLGARLKVDEGSKYEGIQRFKERFGGKLTSGFLWRFRAKSFKGTLFYFIIRMRNFVKSGRFQADTIDQEAWKWR